MAKKSAEPKKIAEPKKKIKELPKEEPTTSAVADVDLSPWLNKMNQGDCLTVMKTMPSQSVDLIVTSPPYNLRNSTGGGMRNGSGGKWEKAALLQGYADDTGEHHEDDMPVTGYIGWQMQCVTEMMRILKPTGALFYNHKWRVQDGLLQNHAGKILADFPLRQIIIWHRSGGFNFNANYFLPSYEEIYLVCNKGFKLHGTEEKPKGDCGKSDVWKITQELNNSHPAPFPVEIPARCIHATGAKIVLDPFMGSGTTAVAAKQAGIEWIGIELSKQYCEVATERIAKTQQVPFQ